VADESSAGRGSSGTWQPQYRLQLSATGSLESYHINVLQAKSVGDADVIATLEETPRGFSVKVRREGREEIVVTLDKGMTSSGGAFRSGAVTSSFGSGVQGIRVSRSGVAWD
jgi:hypothetical protein